MREKKTRVGSGVTSFNKVQRIAETPEEIVGAVRSWARQLDAPFDAFLPWVRAAERELIQYRQECGAAWKFRAHEEPGWYCEEIISRDRFAREKAVAGDAQWAIFHAARLGMLIVEAELKFKLEPLVSKVEQDRGKRASAAVETHRKMPAKHRVTIMQQIFDTNPQLSVRAAANVAANRNPGLGKWQVYKRDWDEREIG